MFKKILITLGLFLVLFSSVNAGTTYLNSCGNTNWIDNEQYILNFTKISTTNPNTFCFSNFGSNKNNISFYGVNPIDIQKNLNTFFSFGLGINYNNFKFNNITIHSTTNNNINYFMSGGGNGGNGGGLINFTYNNFNLKNTNFFIFSSTSIVNTNVLAGNSYHNNHIFINSNLNLNTAYFYIAGGNVFNPRGYSVLKDWKFISSIINVPIFSVTGYGGGVIGTTGWNSYNSIILNYQNGILNNSISKNFKGIDLNNDNIADNGDLNHINMVMSKSLFGNFYIQDFKEGLPFITNNQIITPIQNENISLSNSALLLGLNTNNKLNPRFVNYNILDPTSVDVPSTTQINCLNNENSKYCVFKLIGNTVYNNIFRGAIVLGSNTLINNIIMEKNSVNDWNFISNNVELYRNNITISNNNFSINRTNEGTTAINSYNIIKLKGNNINIFNNTFFLNDTVNTQEILYIDSLNSNSNSIYNNIFTHNNASTFSEVFTFKSDTKFYNNYLDSGINLTNQGLVLSATNQIGFKHTNGNIYYYTIGNYYVDNTGCIDNNFDGICDSIYVSGTKTDSAPLSSYPFDYTQHLLTADFIINPNIFNVSSYVNSNLLNSNQNINILNSNSPINLGFSHTSDFIDLTCDFILNGISVNGATITNPIKNQIYSNNFTGWIQGNNSFRTECYNNFEFRSSQEYILNILITNNPNNNTNPNNNNTNPNNNNTNPNLNNNDLIYTNSNPIDYNSISNTNQNTIGFMGDIISFATNVGIPLGILVVIIVSFLAVLRLII